MSNTVTDVANEVQVLRKDIKSWAEGIATESKRYQNAYWWSVSSPEKERLSLLLGELSITAGRVKAILAAIEAH